MKQSILLVEDEEDLRMMLTDRLKGEGYSVATAVNGEDGFRKAMQSTFNLIILDVMLPMKSGLDVCRDLRTAGCSTPILMLTAKSLTLDKVLALKLGADDYLTKPFEALELNARIEALLRRTSGLKTSRLMEFGNLKVDIRGTTVTREGRFVDLSAREFRLLEYFVQHAGQTISRSELLREVWGHDKDPLTRTVDVHVATLRQKLERNPKKPELLLTVPGLGYRWASPPYRANHSS